MPAREVRLARLGLRLEDFEESFARSSGPGGQHVNKVSTAVTLRHGPSGAAVTVQDSRSQSYEPSARVDAAAGWDRAGAEGGAGGAARAVRRSGGGMRRARGG